MAEDKETEKKKERKDLTPEERRNHVDSRGLDGVFVKAMHDIAMFFFGPFVRDKDKKDASDKKKN
ncbi:hypothetical protein GW765_04225 [Candidatus Parcubacteria bacterium]|nr:hypothetical protein [Candidatus Parcubacteria bacterium]